MLLSDLIVGLEAELSGDPATEIAGLAYDSRDVGDGTLFFCIPGERADGHDFAAQAVQAGASALVCERRLELDVAQLDVTQVCVADARAAMAPVAAHFYGNPSSELDIVGITGTNGKTTTAFLLRGILEAVGNSCGMLGTVKRIVGGVEEEVERTTPEAIDLQRDLRRMVDAGDRACAMEVSSHALILHRADRVGFDIGVFTNLTQDHLDFHADMEEYFAAKRRLFDLAEHAVINVDDEWGRRLTREIRIDGSTFSAAGEPADFRAVDVSYDATGAHFRLVAPDGEAMVRMPLPGEFNVANALAAIAAARNLGVEMAAAVEALAAAERVPGRFEPVDGGQSFAVLVDYAHTPDSLENALRAARQLTAGRLICVFGCGGDRDRDKRPLMGRAAAELSDLALVTSDNPRSEDPQAIIDEILAGVGEGAAGVEAEPDRRRAIALALAAAGPGDTVLIAGKGHEQGQEFEGGRKLPFDDRQVALEELERLPGGGQ